MKPVFKIESKMSTRRWWATTPEEFQPTGKSKNT